MKLLTPNIQKKIRMLNHSFIRVGLPPVPDKWLENYPVPGPWTPDVRFNKYEEPNGPPLPDPDVYVRPTELPPDPGTGFTLAVDYGTELGLVATKIYGKFSWSVKYADYDSDFVAAGTPPPFALDTKIFWITFQIKN